MRATFHGNHDRIALWDMVACVGDSRPMLLVLATWRRHTPLLVAAWRSMGELPPVVQCALVAIPETGGYDLPEGVRLCAAAQQLLDADAARQLAECAVYESLMSSLLAHRMGAVAPSSPLTTPQRTEHA